MIETMRLNPTVVVLKRLRRTMSCTFRIESQSNRSGFETEDEMAMKRYRKGVSIQP